MGRSKPTRVVGNLPFAVTSFVGRQREIREVRELLATARLVTLTGVGGVGKTRLASEAAAASGRSFPDGAWLVDLSGINDADLVAQAVLTSLAIVDVSNRTVEEQLIEHLADMQTLVVLDNCEHLVDVCGELCCLLLRSCAGLRILATSRELLGVAGEHVYTVPPLSMPNPHDPVRLEVLAAYDAPTMLVERARAVRPGLTLTERDVDVVVQVCERLDGIPLAIELAASRLRSLSLPAVLDRLEDRFALLAGGMRAAAPRQRTLRALIDWSYELCQPAERLLWARLSVFAGGFTLAAAEGVCAGPDLPRERILDLIDHLVAQSILALAPTGGPPRYRMLETIREYGWHRLTERDETDALRKRHCDHYLAHAERIAEEWNGPGQAAGLAELRAERDNLQAALDWATSTPTGSREALALVTALRYHWCADGFLGEGRRWIDKALRVAGQTCPERIAALWVAGWVRLLQGDLEAATAALDECATGAAAVGDRHALGWVCCLRGTAELFPGHLASATAAFEQAVEDYSDDEDVVRMTLFQLAMTQVHAGDSRAGATARRGIELADQRGERWTKSCSLWALGYDQYVRGECDKAAESTRAALEIQREFNDHVGAALMMESLAWIAAAGGEYRQAARLLGAVGSVWRRIGTSIAAFGPHLGAQHSACEHTLTRSLPQAVQRAERTRGAALDHTQAIMYALDPSQTAQEPDEQGDIMLTARERQVAELVAQGLSNRQIAQRLVVSPRTVDRHLENILCKLGYSSRAQIAAWTARLQTLR
ncbi:LuxR C-terminal-related transcriptional regulator [Nocardia sp. NBC_00565]|uniref:ATP-binding protein n=1 Tax=Nocardia sp. NBC_00565 TaxID=2975993 RepID=UPI002E81E6CE|nr:LuxR C-terminal-related transcriptional regulator [Nocardia sp. NBC_00565]WUC06456.1 LuxR C-terminal-related transcriptional regulator [Nocardia sp. NBC_00565]